MKYFVFIHVFSGRDQWMRFTIPFQKVIYFHWELILGSSGKIEAGSEENQGWSGAGAGTCTFVLTLRLTISPTLVTTYC